MKKGDAMIQGFYSLIKRRQLRRKRVCTCAVVLALALSLTAIMRRPESQAVMVDAEVSFSGYTAISEHNLIVIYRNGEEEPMLFTNIDVRSLPATDQEMLESGISLADADDISRLLEDYGS